MVLCFNIGLIDDVEVWIIVMFEVIYVSMVEVFGFGL